MAWLGGGLRRKEKHGEKTNHLDFTQDLRLKVMGTLLNMFELNHKFYFQQSSRLSLFLGAGL